MVVRGQDDPGNEMAAKDVEMSNQDFSASKVAPNQDPVVQTSIAERGSDEQKDEPSKAEEASADSANGGSFKRIGESLELN